MKTIAHLFRPTLVRRVFLALLLAMSLAWLIVMWMQISDGNQSRPAYLKTTADSILNLLKETNDADQAVTIVKSSIRVLNDNMRALDATDSFTVQLSDRQGKVLFASATTIGPDSSANLNDANPSMRTIDGTYLIRSTSGNWTLTLAIYNPTVADSIRLLASDVTIVFLVIFLIILIAIWFAVSRGLRPLRQMSNQIAAKDEDNLQPLNFNTRYAELRPVAEAINGLLIQLQNKINRERVFVQNAAHELRTPMAVISVQAHVLALADSPEERKEAEDRLNYAIARASHLIQQMLKLAKVDGERPMTCEHVDVAQLVRQELAGAASFAMAKNIELSLDAADTLIFLTESETFLMIFNNLVDNSIRYVQPGAKIVVELRKEHNELILTVTDNGPGIAENERALVFERFYRAAGQEVFGSGLGLAIVKQAATRLGGKIHLGPGPDGSGCQFIVSTPDQSVR